MAVRPEPVATHDRAAATGALAKAAGRLRRMRPVAPAGRGMKPAPSMKRISTGKMSPRVKSRDVTGSLAHVTTCLVPVLIAIRILTLRGRRQLCRGREFLRSGRRRLFDDLGRLLAILEPHIIVLDGEGNGAGGAAGTAVFPLDLHGKGDRRDFALEGEKLVHDLAGVEVELEDIVGPGAVAELTPSGRPSDGRAAEIGGLFEDDAARSPVGKLLDDALGLEADMDGEAVAAPGKEGGDRGVAVIADGEGVEIDKETHTFGREASTPHIGRRSRRRSADGPWDTLPFSGRTGGGGEGGLGG